MIVSGAILVLHFCAQAIDPLAASAQRKIDEIRNDKAKSGSVYIFTPAEINAWARKELPTQIPQGMRDPAVQLGLNQATGFAYVDFLKMQHAKGARMNWLIEKLIEGERPMRVSVEMKTANGIATVYLRRVEISGVSAGGTVLDFLIRTFFRPLYPDAHIDEPFEMSHSVERIEVRPDGARVYIQRKPASAARLQN